MTLRKRILIGLAAAGLMVAGLWSGPAFARRLYLNDCYVGVSITGRPHMPDARVNRYHGPTPPPNMDGPNVHHDPGETYWRICVHRLPKD